MAVLPRTTHAWTVGPGAERRYLLTNAVERSITFQRQGPAVANFTLRGEDEWTANITELVDDLKIHRNGELFFRGRIGPSSDTGSANGQVCAFTAHDYRGRLSKRLLWDNQTLLWTDEPQHAIVWEMVTAVQSRANGNEGVTQATGYGTTAGELTERSYEAQPGQTLEQAISQLGNATNGFDWEVDEHLQLRLFSPERGTTRPVTLDYSGAFTEYNRTFMFEEYANSLRVTGADDTIETQIITSADVIHRPEGRWEMGVGWPDSASQIAHDDNAAWMLQETQQRRYSYTIELTPNFWRGKDHFWLGDKVTLAIHHGRINVEELKRVETMTFHLQSNGTERISVGLQ